MNKIKVLHLHTLPIIGGSGIGTFLTIKGLNKEKYQVELACGCPGELIDLVERENLTVRPIRYLRQKINIAQDILSFFSICALLMREKYDIVHTHNSKAGVIGRLAAWFTGRPIIIHTVHGWAFKHPNLNKFQKMFYYYIEKFCALITDKLIIVSRPLKEESIATGIGTADKYTIIYSGIELEKFRKKYDVQHIKDSLHLKAGSLVVGTVSRIVAGKGHKELLYAAKEVLAYFENTVFLIVGEGPLIEEIKNLAKRLGIEKNVIFTGARNNDIEKITSIFDLAVLPSYYEGMGRVLLEAQAAGIPVIATRAGGMKEIVRENYSGLLVTPGSIEELSAAISKLLNDTILRKEMGKRAFEWVDEKFSIETTVKQITNVYEELLNKKLKKRQN